MNIQTLKKIHEILRAKFALKTLRHDKVKTMFKPNTKNNMNLRKKDKLKVTKTKTTRLKKSAITTMEHLINTHFHKLDKDTLSRDC